MKKKSRELFNANNELAVINKNLENFVHTVAHDFKAPIRVIINFLNLIDRKKTNQFSEEIDEYLQFIRQSSFSLSNFVDELLKYSKQIRIDINEFELVNLNDLFDESIKILDPLKQDLNYEFE